MQDVLGTQALSAGAWYVPSTSSSLCCWPLLDAPGLPFQPALAADRRRWCWALMLASLFFFNRHPDWDPWALYLLRFLRHGRRSVLGRPLASPGPGAGAGLAMVGLLALMLEFRTALRWPCAVALLLGLVQWQRRSHMPAQYPLPQSLRRATGQLGQIFLRAFFWCTSRC